MKHIERRATLERNTRGDQTVCANGVEDVEQADHTLQRRGLKLPFGSNSSKALGRYFHSHALKAGFNRLWRQENTPRLDQHRVTGLCTKRIMLRTRKTRAQAVKDVVGYT